MLFVVASICAFHLPMQGQTAGAPSHPVSPLRDGQHDFDFNLGTWHTRITRIPDPLGASSASITLDGTVTVRGIWGGRGQLEEIEADGPQGRWEGLTMFLYNPEAHQWNQTFLDSQTPTLSPPLIGSFHNGRGELIAQDTFHGKTILIKGEWSDILPDSHHYQESYSNNAGKTWFAAFKADLTRVPAGAAKNLRPLPPSADTTSAAHAFDFDIGKWKTHTSRLLHPLTGSNVWVELDGVTEVHEVWGGRANLAEYKANGADTHIELLSLRWFDPTTHEWTLDFSTPGVGMFGVPSVGEFRGERGDFYDYEPVNGRNVLVRFSIWKISDREAQSEQAFSDDGGRTWEVNWINRYTRA
jgi:hypothetical protein